ncbi:putative collagen triple helix [Bacillus clarus]|nr:putative collagen triple helix [Bacillus clarus]
MSKFKKKFHIPCECFLPPVPPLQIGPTGPTGPGPIVRLQFLYVANPGDDTVEIYDITNPIIPVRVGEFNGGNLDQPLGMAIFSLFG